jgi:hypothetical protein
MANESPRLKNRSWNTDRNQHNGRSDYRNRGGGVHGDAERAVIGSGFSLMEVRDLDDSEDGQKNKAQNCHHRQSTRLSVAFLAEMWLESWQSRDPLLKDTQIWMRRRWRWLRVSKVFEANERPTPGGLIRLNCVR